MSIRFKIFLTFIIAIFVPFTLIALLVTSTFRSALQSQIITKLETRANLQKSRIEDLLQDDHYTLEMARKIPHLSEDVVSLQKTGKSASQPDLKSKLLATKKLSSKILSITILTPQAQVIASTNEQLIGIRYAREAFFTKGTTGVNVSTLARNPDGTIVQKLVAPILDKNEIVGILVVDISARPLFDLFSDHTGLGKTGEWGLATHAANGDALVIVPGRLDSNPDSPLVKTISKSLSSAPINHALNREEITLLSTLNYKHIPVIAVTRYIPEVDWGLGVTLPQEEAYEDLFIILRQLSFFFLIVCFLTVALSIILSDVVTKPILRLALAARKVTNKDYSSRVSVTSTNEIGQLSQTFNEMVEAIGYHEKQNKTLNDAKDEFLSIAAHQLRTPLGSMRWQMEQILNNRHGHLSKPLTETVQGMYESNLQLIALINDLLSVSHVNQGKVSVQMEQTTFAAVAHTLFDEITPLARLKNISLKTASDDMNTALFVDKQLLHQVLLNLLTNSLEYNKDGREVTIRVSSDTKITTITITDAGIGIQKDIQSRVFEKFTRGKNSSKYNPHGTGLGLFIVKSYVELMHGSIVFQSKPGKGTTFTLEFPVHKGSTILQEGK